MNGGDNTVYYDGRADSTRKKVTRSTRKADRK